MVGIYYISTGSYKVWLDGFLQSLSNFRVGKDKKLILLVDEPIDTTKYEIEIEQHIISDAPWPIVTLLKMWYIYKYRGDYDEVYYFNANAQVKSDLPDCGDKLLLTRHYKHNPNNALDGCWFLKIEDDNPKSYSYIGLHEYTYAMASFFGGKADVVYKMCSDVSKWVESDLKRFVIPRWHDESYLNKWQTMNKELCEIINVWNNVELVYNDKFIPKK